MVMRVTDSGCSFTLTLVSSPSLYLSQASYSNFRYYSEMLASGAMDPVVATALMEFRETNGGCLSGMTRYTDHLDDMPAIGYAISSLHADRVEQFLLLLYGHAANYQGRGSFLSNEQQSLYQNTQNPAWRQSMGEIQASFCTPSQTLVASMTAMQFVSTDRDNATIWIARGVPRRWFSSVPAPGAGGVVIGAKGAPSRWGTVTFAVVPNSTARTSLVSLDVDFTQPAGARVHTPTFMVRVRDPRPGSGSRNVTGAVASHPAGQPDCEVVDVLTGDDVVVVQPSPTAVSASAVTMCHLTVHF